jgi:hypothetical protein
MQGKIAEMKTFAGEVHKAYADHEIETWIWAERTRGATIGDEIAA